MIAEGGQPDGGQSFRGSLGTNTNGLSEHPGLKGNKGTNNLQYINCYLIVIQFGFLLVRAVII